MGVRGCPPMPGNMLQDRQHPALFQPFRYGARDRRDLAGLGSVSAVADHRVRPGHRNVRQWQAINSPDGASDVPILAIRRVSAPSLK